MSRKFKYYKLVWLKYDLRAGLTVFLVALPLCLGIALAAGVPLYAGLLSGIIGGIIVGILSGASLAVSGPAAGLTTLISLAILSVGSYNVFLLSIIIAGFLQMLMGVLKMGSFANYFPSSVIKGMIAAIGLLLIFKQIPVAFGYNKKDFWTSSLFNITSFDHDTLQKTNFSNQFSLASIIIFFISLLILILFKQKFLKKSTPLPPSLIVVIIGILLSSFVFTSDAKIALPVDQLVHIPLNIFSEIQYPSFSAIFSNTSIWKNGLIISIVASLETLLCIEAIDKLDKRNRITPINRELVVQGVGNIFCGILGAIPLTAVVVRGAANIDAGARTKLATITHGVFLLLALLFIPVILNKIPYAALSAILIMVGYSLTKPRLYKSIWALGWKQFLPFITTILLILSTDLLMGVTMGLLFATYFIIQNNFKAQYKIIHSAENHMEHYFIKLNSNVSFLNKVNLRKVLDEVPENSILIIDGSDCNFIDYDILETISSFSYKAKTRKILLNLKNIKEVETISNH